MPWIINQADKCGNIARGPFTATKLISRGFGVWCLLDQFNDLINRSQRNHQTGQHMCPVTCLAKQIYRAPRYHILAELTEGRDHVLQAHLDRPAAIHRQHIDREAGLQAGMAIKLVQHHIASGITLDFNDDPHTFAIGLIADVGNALNHLVTNHFTDPLKQLRLVHLIGDFVNDDLLTITCTKLNFSPGPHDN